jgi:hypothetical protein
VNFKQIKILLDNDFFWFEEDYYLYKEIEYDYSREAINWKTSKDGLVDWSDEVPKSIKRLKKLEEILNNKTDSYKNTIDNYWPKSL